MPRRRLAFAVRVGLPRATMKRSLASPASRGWGGGDDGLSLPGSSPAGRCLMTPSAALATIQPALPAPNARLPPGSWPGTAA
jgi:hypothetical protein